MYTLQFVEKLTKDLRNGAKMCRHLIQEFLKGAVQSIRQI